MTTAEHADDLDKVDQVELLIGRRWTAKILMALLDQGAPMRFGELLAAVPGLSKRLLTDRLTDLEHARLVHRQVDPGRPITITYQLTPRGAALRSTFLELRAWARAESA